jgi:transposase-like protein
VAKRPKAEREKNALAANGFTPEKRARFLAVFAEGGNMTSAARAVDISRPTIYEWREKDEDFAAAFADAKEQALDALEGEARRRAMGWRDVVVTQEGREIEVYKHSDTLLIFLLKGANPEKYRERHELSGDPKRPLFIRKAEDLSDDELAGVIGAPE